MALPSSKVRKALMSVLRIRAVSGFRYAVSAEKQLLPRCELDKLDFVSARIKQTKRHSSCDDRLGF
jgi:hypothetical protein